MHRLFLDANVLFSAAYLAESRFLLLWRLADVELWTSDYAIDEARRNLPRAEQQARLDDLLKGVHISADDPAAVPWPAGIDLPEKDRPILLQAIASRATHLLTGDRRHFGALYDRVVADVLILPPSSYPPAG